MWNWLKELYDIRRENAERARYCDACEVLKVELSRERREKEMLLNRLLNPVNEPEPETRFTDAPPILPRHVPWRVKQQELEAKDRQEHQRILKNFETKLEDSKRQMASESIAKLEKELGVSDAG